MVNFVESSLVCVRTGKRCGKWKAWITVASFIESLQHSHEVVTTSKSMRDYRARLGLRFIMQLTDCTIASCLPDS